MAKRIADQLGQTYSCRQYQKLEAGEFPKYKKGIVAAIEEILSIKINELIYAYKVCDCDSASSHEGLIPTGLKSDEVIYVSVVEQIEYPIRFQDSLYIKNLCRIRLFDRQYHGYSYRVFEVKDDLMEPYFVQGDWVLCQKIDPVSSLQIAEWNPYIIILKNEIILRCMAVRDEENVIACNVKLSQQSSLSLNTIKELWKVVYIIRWAKPVIKKFKITI